MPVVGLRESTLLQVEGDDIQLKGPRPMRYFKFGEEPVVGDEIEVVEGPLKGLRGVFKRELTERERVLILLDYVSYQGQLIIEKKK